MRLGAGKEFELKGLGLDTGYRAEYLVFGLLLNHDLMLSVPFRVKVSGGDEEKSFVLFSLFVFGLRW